MLTGIITAVIAAVSGVAAYVVVSCRRTETQKYYEAAHKMIKEVCLSNALKNQALRENAGEKLMVYLKWKDQKKQGYVFDPEHGVRIGRTPRENEICIREETVSGRHCVLYLSGGRLAVQDLGSANGTWIKRGLRKHPVRGAEYLFTGDKIVVGGLKITVTVFTFDMAYI